jgi:uncharacterized protein (DUF2267 family)
MGQAVQKLAPQLTADQAQAALIPVLDFMRDTLQISMNALQALAQTVHALPAQPTAEQMQLALGGVLDMLLLVGPTSNAGYSKRVGKAIEALAPKLTTDQAEAALRAILHAMFSRGWLGAGLQPVSKETAGSLGLPKLRGAFVGAVMSGSPADNAKILAGDVILTFDGKTIDRVPTLVRLIAGERPGKEVVVTLWRGGEKKDLTVKLGEDTVRLGEDLQDAMKSVDLTAMANALKALPVQLTAEQAQLAHSGILKVLRQNTPKSYARHVMAELVEALAPKLTDEAKADMLGVARSGLGAAGSGDLSVYWARAFEALLSPSPANAYVAAIVEVLKYPTTAIKNPRWEYTRRRDPGGDEPSSATAYLQKQIYDRFPNAKELESGNPADLVDWIAKNYPKIDLVCPPARPGFS